MTPVILLTAILLGLRHALDPDHLTAVLALVISKGGKARDAAKIGLSWGLGHSVSMVVLGLPVILLASHLPEWAYAGAEFLVGAVIIYFAGRLLIQLVNSKFHLHKLPKRQHTHKKAMGVGMLHGVGGSYPGALLVMASAKTATAASIGLLVFTFFSIISMIVVTTLFSMTVLHHKFMHVTNYILIPLFAFSSILFGLWYIQQALGL